MLHEKRALQMQKDKLRVEMEHGKQALDKLHVEMEKHLSIFPIGTDFAAWLPYTEWYSVY